MVTTGSHNDRCIEVIIIIALFSSMSSGPPNQRRPLPPLPKLRPRPGHLAAVAAAAAAAAAMEAASVASLRTERPLPEVSVVEETDSHTSRLLMKSECARWGDTCWMWQMAKSQFSQYTMYCMNHHIALVSNAKVKGS
jgi:hypothetical protein